jgi:hypothetical protein
MSAAVPKYRQLQMNQACLFPIVQSRVAVLVEGAPSIWFGFQERAQTRAKRLKIENGAAMGSAACITFSLFPEYQISWGDCAMSWKFIFGLE